MIIKKKTTVSGEYAKKGEDINPGDLVTILSPGETVEGQFGEQYVFSIKTKNGDKNANFNQTTLNILHDEFGEDTSNWVGKEVVIRGKKTVIAGKKVEVYYFVTGDWQFDDYQELVKVTETGAGETPSPEDIPF